MLPYDVRSRFLTSISKICLLRLFLAVFTPTYSGENMDIVNCTILLFESKNLTTNKNRKNGDLKKPRELKVAN